MTDSDPMSAELQCLGLLKTISEQQVDICRELDELMTLLTLPIPDNVYKLLAAMVNPMASDMKGVRVRVAHRIGLEG